MAHEMTAPLAGKILQVALEVGTKVEEDDDGFIIEAMKMENSIFVPCDGTVTEVRVKPGDLVEEDDVIAVIEDQEQ